MIVIENYNVEAYLKAVGVSEFSRAFKDASKSVEGVEGSSKRAGITIGKMIGAMAGIAGAIGLFRTLRGAIDGAVSRYDTLNNFPKVLQQVGFTAEESEKAISDLSDGIQGLPTKLDDVAGTAQQIAVMTGDLEGATSTTLALNNAFLASGADANEASRGVDQYIKMLSRGKPEMDSWSTLQETMGVALNDVAKSFGFAGESAQMDLYDALKDGDIAFKDFNARLIEMSEETDGFADRASVASAGLRTAWKNANTAVARGVTEMITKMDEFLAKTPFKSIQNIIETMGRSFFDVLKATAGLIEPVGNGLINLYNILKPYAPVIMAILTAVMGFVGTIAVINSVTSAVGLLVGAVKTLGAILLANPIGVVVGLLAGLAYMFYHLYKTSDTFRESVNNAFQSMKETVMPVIRTVVDFVRGVWGSLVSWWDENSQGILNTAISVWSTIQSYVMAFVTDLVAFVMSIWTTLTTFWQENGQMILTAVRNVWTVISTVIGTAVTIIWNIIQLIFPIIKMIVISTWEAIKGAITGAINVILGVIQFFSALFTGNWSAMWEAVKTIIGGAVQFIWNFVQISFVGKLVKLIKTFAKLFSKNIKSLWETVQLIFMYSIDFIRNFFTKNFNSIRKTATGFIDTVRLVFMYGMDFIRRVVTNAIDTVRLVFMYGVDFIKSLVSRGFSTIKSTISRIVGSFFGIVKGAFSRVTGAVRSGINSALRIVTGIASKFLNAGRNIVTSIAKGITGAIGKVTGAISNVTKKIRDFLPFSPAKAGALRDIMKVKISESIAKSIDKGRGKAVKSMRSLSNAIDSEMPSNRNMASEINSLHKRSNHNMAYNFENAVTVQKQPAYINVTVGKNRFTEFVEDITEVQDRNKRTEKAFR